MKKIKCLFEVKCKSWQNGSGFSYESILDQVDTEYSPSEIEEIDEEWIKNCADNDFYTGKNFLYTITLYKKNNDNDYDWDNPIKKIEFWGKPTENELAEETEE